MANLNSVLNQRINKKSTPSSKMAAMAKQSASGQLTSFAGVFSVAELTLKEKEILENILRTYAPEEQRIDQDLDQLISLTSEVKAINNQAALLHGERIKRVHSLLTRYRDGAFTAWLLAAYGNRQTPYNLMQYYEFCEAMPRDLRPQIEAMPRQAIYVLATRSGSLTVKQHIVENYQGETKAEVLTLIRQTFPLNEEDKRQQKVGQGLIVNLKKLIDQLKESAHSLNSVQKKNIRLLISSVHELLGD
jgi:Uncharacterised protein family (UPF0137)